MDIKRMKKSELIELNGQLNESREHCDAVIEALRAQPAQAESPVATGSAQAHSMSQRVVRNNKLIHEFDPEVQGSYVVAMRRARELGGVVRRAQQ